MRTLLALTLILTACDSHTTEPKKGEGAFEIGDVVKTTSDEARISVERSAVPLEEMAFDRWLAGLPMRGMAHMTIDLSAPRHADRTLFSRARGTLAFECTDCQIGDDSAQLEIAGQKLDVGHLDIKSLALRGTVDGGHAKLTTWELASPDVKLDISMDIALADDLAASKIEGCIRFAPASGLDKRRPKTWAVLQTTGANVDHSGMYSIRITGTLGTPKRLAQACDARARS
ncbi:MAG: type II secretion system protein GspN [Kofleriaceae bacterium]|nr:type II secretion system protein GspN [Kofleriaceae bacterium]